MDDILRTLQDSFAALPSETRWAAGGAIAALVALLVLWRLLRRRRVAETPLQPQLTLDIGSLSQQGPPAEGPVLEFYNMPVRVAAIVLAPAGRVGQIPPAAELAEVFDAIIPELSRVVAAHQPEIRRWPAQLSARGFAMTFFANTVLPGECGKGTPWSSAAGIFRIGSRSYMAGIVLRAATPNSFGQAVLDSPEKWLGCMRVRG